MKHSWLIGAMFCTFSASAEPPDIDFVLPDHDLDIPKILSKIATTDSLECQEVLELVPPAWTAPFGKLRLEGTIVPRLEVLTSPKSPDLEFRIHGIDSPEHHCKVAEFEWESKDVDWLNTNFTKKVDPRYLPPGTEVKVGPGTPDFVPISELPKFVPAAMVYSEEHGFYENQGFSAHLIARAMSRNQNEGQIVTGGSTITQQLVKNLFLTRDKTLERKFQEVVIATRVWQKVSKERVLELYLNCIEFGSGIWGIGPAARFYFAKDARDLTITEAAFLAAIKPQPLQGELVRAGKLDLEESGLAATIQTIIRTIRRHE